MAWDVFRGILSEEILQKFPLQFMEAIYNRLDHDYLFLLSSHSSGSSASVDLRISK